MKPPRKLTVTPLIVVFWDEPMWRGKRKVFTDRVDDLEAAFGDFTPCSMTIYAGPDYHMSEDKTSPAYWQARFFTEKGCKYRGIRVPDEDGREGAEVVLPPLGPGFYQDCMFPEGLNWTEEIDGRMVFTKIKSIRFVEHKFTIFNDYLPPQLKEKTKR
ncbi:MAG: hypothetical protein JW984_08115 [Deltaproteobacteria bacterium]|uniref:Uncharacterized protein n=1 Tax=Candidatus Zymogenus saltonus TaxID=2844893 RepID=A0A9D8KDM4_9DELT|nr:hypothetical protein [Candidatus Zymogenus saltonus]